MKTACVIAPTSQSHLLVSGGHLYVIGRSVADAMSTRANLVPMLHREPAKGEHADRHVGDDHAA